MKPLAREGSVDRVEPLRLTLRIGHQQISASHWDGDGEFCLLFVHGLGEGAWVWDPIVEGVRGRNRAVTFDLRGHGESGWAKGGDYSVNAHAQDLLELVDRLDLRSLVLVAHSFGAAVAVRALPLLASRLAGMVVVDMAASGGNAGTEAILHNLLSGPQDFPDHAACIAYLVATRPLGDPSILARYAHRSVHARADGRLVWRRDPCAVEGVALPAMSLRDAQCPVLVVRGAVSSVLSSSMAERLAASAQRGDHLVIPGAGHAIMSENPNQLIAALAGFLARLDTVRP